MTHPNSLQTVEWMKLDLKDRSPRFTFKIPVRYRPSGATDWQEGRTENISRSGVLFRTDHLMPIQTPIDLLLSLPAEVGGGGSATVICRGRIVRTEPPNPGDARPAVAATIAGYRLAHTPSGHEPGSDQQSHDPRRI